MDDQNGSYAYGGYNPQPNYQNHGSEMTSSEVYYQLISSGVDEDGATEVNNLVTNRVVGASDITEKVTAELVGLTTQVIQDICSELSKANIEVLKNKEAYLIGLIKTHKKKVPGSMQTSTMPSSGDQSIDMNQANISFNKFYNNSLGLGPSANEDAIKKLLVRTGYKLELSPGQRQYTPSLWDGEKPGKGCEVFIGGLLRETFEDSLVPMLEDCGTIFDLRIMANSADGTNKGFAFCIFSSAEEAKAAVARLNGKPMGRNRTLKVNLHNPNTRLFVGGVDKSKDKEEILYTMAEHTPGLTDVILKSDTENPRNKHRGFVFLDYSDHKHATNALKKIMLPSTLIFGRNLFADWAEPLVEASDEVMAAVKVLYVKGLSMYVTEDILKDRFSPYGTVDSVKKLKDYAFVHFQNRTHALQAMNDLNGARIEDSTIEVTLAKPGNKKKEPLGRGGFSGGRGGAMVGGRGGGAMRGAPPIRGRGGPPMSRGFGASRGAASRPHAPSSYSRDYDEYDSGYSSSLRRSYSNDDYGNNSGYDNGYRRGQSSYSRGQSSYGRGQSSYGRGQSSYGRGQSSYGRGQSSYGRDQSSFGRGQSSYGSGQSSYGAGESSYGRGQSSYESAQSAYRSPPSEPMRGALARGAPRGVPRGAASFTPRGRGVPPSAAGMKRAAAPVPPPSASAYGAYDSPAAKRPKPYDGWATAPIAQQPLSSGYGATSRSADSSWYSDSY